MHQLSRKYVALVLLASLVLVAGCDEKVRKAALAAKDFSVAVRTFQDAEIAAHESKQVADNEHGQIQQLLIEVAKSGKELDNAINVAHSQGKATVSLQAAIDSTDRLLNDGVLHVKNADKRTQLQMILISARGLLATVSAVLEGK